ncbi:MAG TPA: hypothetical protein VIM61_04740 [Chthoniobacterales bacterium]
MPTMTMSEAMAFLTSDGRELAKPVPEVVAAPPSEPIMEISSENPNSIKKWHSFSRKLAVDVNDKAPDITAAIILHRLLLWKRHGRKRWNAALKNGVSCYRSLAELESDLPYLSRSGIDNGLKRLAQHFGDDIDVHREGRQKLTFTISDKIEKKYMSASLGFFVEGDALEHGILAAMVLNILRQDRLEYEVRHGQGSGWELAFRLSSSSLSKVRLVQEGTKQVEHPPVIPASSRSISRALSSLVAAGVICQADKAGYYAEAHPIGESDIAHGFSEELASAHVEKIAECFLRFKQRQVRNYAITPADLKAFRKCLPQLRMLGVEAEWYMFYAIDGQSPKKFNSAYLYQDTTVARVYQGLARNGHRFPTRQELSPNMTKVDIE